MRLTYQQRMKPVSTYQLKCHVEALIKLRKGYRREGLDDCPLCSISLCHQCPWKYMTGYSCTHDLSRMSISRLRMFPTIYREQAIKRAVQITKWLKTIRCEIKRRSDAKRN